jgi:hypothetical protein
MEHRVSPGGQMIRHPSTHAVAVSHGVRRRCGLRELAAGRVSADFAGTFATLAEIVYIGAMEFLRATDAASERPRVGRGELAVVRLLRQRRQM